MRSTLPVYSSSRVIPSMRILLFLFPPMYASFLGAHMYLDTAFSFDLRVWGVLPDAAVLPPLLGMVELHKSSWSRSLEFS